jgi:hypothetical protein
MTTKSAKDLLAANGITLACYEPGQYSSTCPKCSADRSTKEHRAAKVLGVKIDAKGVVWHCNHCNWSGPEKGSGKQQGRQELTSYIYRDADGIIRFRKVRNRPGKQPRFWLERLENGKWIKGTKGEGVDVDTSIIYRADEVQQAIAEGRVVACVEGEKDADNLWRIDIPATCNAHGAHDPTKKQKSKWTKRHSEQLAGADLVVFNDNDASGYEHADATCKLSLGIAKRVRCLDLAPHWPEIPKGGDVSDWLKSKLGRTRDEVRDELLALIVAAPDYAPQDGKPPQEEAASDDADAEITRLAKLSPLDYGRERKGAAKKLGVPVSILDRVVRDERAKLGLDADDDKLQGHAIEFPEVEPWPEPVGGTALLDDLAKAIRRHVVMSDSARDETALWVTHAYMFDRFLVSPRLGVTSPVKGCGKTTLLDVLGRLVPRALPTANVTPAALFRVVEGYRPTLLVDEADTFLRDNDELRGVLNSGHRKGGTVLRTVGDDHEPRAFSTFCPTVIALIGTLPDTLHDRAVGIDLKRKLPTETVEPFRPDRADHLDVLARKLVRWSQDNAERVAAIDPEMPAGIINREADNWRPLLAIAEVADGEWPKRAREAAEAAHAAAGGDEASRLELLLGDIRDAFAAKGTKARDMLGAEKIEIASADLVEALKAIEGRPWADGMGRNHDKPLTQNMLARMLKKLKPPVIPEKIGPEKERVSGYLRERFQEAFERYLPLEGASQPDTRTQAHEIRTSDIFKPDTADDGCPVANMQETQQRRASVRMSSCEGRSKDETPIADDEPPPLIPCAHCGGTHGDIYQTNDLHRATSFDRGTGAPIDCPSIFLHPDCVAAYFAEPLLTCTHCGQTDRAVYRTRRWGDPLSLTVPLHDRCIQGFLTGQAGDGLSVGALRDLADKYSDQVYEQYEQSGDVRAREVDAWLRQTLSTMVPPEHIEAEFQRVMTLVFTV